LKLHKNSITALAVAHFNLSFPIHFDSYSVPRVVSNLLLCPRISRCQVHRCSSIKLSNLGHSFGITANNRAEPKRK